MAARGLRQADLARLAQVKPSSVAQWRNGRTKEISGETLLLAASALGCSPKWLATGVGPVSEDQRPPVVAETTSWNLEPFEREILKLVRTLPKAGRDEALTLLQYVASKHGAPHPTGAQQRDPVPGAKRAA